MIRAPLSAYLLFVASISISIAAEPVANSFSAEVVTVVDGDTIGVLVGEKEVRIRLEGIDAPERSQEGGPASTRFLRSLVENQVVKVEQTGTDKYGRMLGVVSTKAGSVNSRMISEGWAWHFKKYSTDETLAKLETRARTTGVGIWKTENPMSPWEYRSQKKLTEPGVKVTEKAADAPQEPLAKTQPLVKNKQINTAVELPVAGAAFVASNPSKESDDRPKDVTKLVEKQKTAPVAKSDSARPQMKDKPSSRQVKVDDSRTDFSTSPNTGASNRNSRGNYNESAAEKAYEKANGVEVVHKKDGTTYERKSRSKK